MKTKRITESAMLIAMAVVLELVSKAIIPEMPFGGQITLCSMLPVVLISYRHGVRWGLLSGAAYAMVQMLLGAKTVAAAFQPGYFGDGTLIVNALIMCLLDYLLAYTLLGLGGCFRGKFSQKAVEPAQKKSGAPAELCLGSVVALSARYAAHILSGYILFSGWAEWFFTQEGFPGWGAALVERLSPAALGLTYSVVYNGMYMLPELVITAVAAALLGRNSQITAKVS